MTSGLSARFCDRAAVVADHGRLDLMVNNAGITFGHLVTTASMGGLMAAGSITSYVMSKHAAVGLSLAMRSEAADKGVGVLAVCPSAVETPILDKGAVGRFPVVERTGARIAA